MSPAAPIPFSRYSGFDRHGISPIGAIAAAPVSAAIAGSLHQVYIIAGAFAVLALVMTMLLPPRLGPRQPLRP